MLWIFHLWNNGDIKASYDLKFAFHNALKLNNSSIWTNITKMKYTLNPYYQLNLHRVFLEENLNLFNYPSKKIMIKKAWANFWRSESYKEVEL